MVARLPLKQKTPGSSPGPAAQALAGGDPFILVRIQAWQPIPKWGSNWMKAKRNIGGLRGIFFYTEDINKTYADMKTNGVKFLKPPFKTPWGEYKAHFVDPDGNEFSLCEGHIHE